MSKKKNIRTAVLDAAVELITSSGSAQLTLDAVAAKAAVSKGGLLHHFRSKEALLVALIERVRDSYDAGVNTTLGSVRDKKGPGAPISLLFEAYINRIFSGFGKGRRDAAAILAVAAHRPELLSPVRDYFLRRSAEVHAELPPPQAHAAMALLMIADGLWLFDALNLTPYEKEDREKVRETVVRWIQQELGPISATAPRASEPAAPARTRKPRTIKATSA